MANLFLTSTRQMLIASKFLVEAYYQGRRISSTELAESLGLQNRSLNPSLNRLKREGILLSQVGGLNPGHKFARDPKEISIGEIVTTLEGPLEMVSCGVIMSTTDTKCSCNAETRCLFCRTVIEIENMAKERIYAVSLYDLYIDSIKDDKNKNTLSSISAEKNQALGKQAAKKPKKEKNLSAKEKSFSKKIFGF